MIDKKIRELHEAIQNAPALGDAERMELQKLVSAIDRGNTPTLRQYAVELGAEHPAVVNLLNEICVLLAGGGL